MSEEPESQRMYTREEVLAIADSWGDLNFWLGKLRGYGIPQADLNNFGLDRGSLDELLKSIPRDVSLELEENAYSGEIIAELARKVDELDPNVSAEEFSRLYGQDF